MGTIVSICIVAFLLAVSVIIFSIGSETRRKERQKIKEFFSRLDPHNPLTEEQILSFATEAVGFDRSSFSALRGYEYGREMMDLAQIIEFKEKDEIKIMCDEERFPGIDQDVIDSRTREAIMSVINRILYPIPA